MILRDQVHIPSTNSSVRVLTTKQDELSLQYILEMPNRKRNVINFRMVMVVAALLSLIWFRKIAIIVVSVSVIVMLYLELSKVCKETVTVIKDTCITYSAATLLGRKKFQSVPINRLLGVVLMENIMGPRVHGIMNLIVRTGEKKCVHLPLFTSLRPNLATLTKMRHNILDYTGEVIQHNIEGFGHEHIMSTADVFVHNQKHLGQSFARMRTKKRS